MTRLITLDALDDAIAGATPPLTDDDRRLVTAIYRRLATGEPATDDTLARDAAVTATHVTERLADWPGIFRDDDGHLVGFWGLAIPEMPHRVVFDPGAAVHAWCAWDPLFIAPIVGPAAVETRDPVTGATIAYTIGPEGVVHADPDQVLSFLAPADTWDHDVLGSFCHYVLHFEGRGSGERWVAEHPGTFLLSLPDAVELGRRHAVRIADLASRGASG